MPPLCRRAEEQITKRAAQQVSDPPLRHMVWPVANHVAALAKALQIAPPIIARVVIQMRCRQYDAGLSHLRRVLDEIRPPRRPAVAIAPSMTGGIEPTPIRQTPNYHSMRPAASLTNPGGALETDSPADLRPVAGIDLPHLSLDRHSLPQLHSLQ